MIIPDRVLKVVYEDDWICAIDKNSGMLSIPDRYDRDLPNVIDTVRTFIPTAEVLHRIDKGTSGLLLVAKSAEAHRTFSPLFSTRAIDKDYLLIVHGSVEPDVGLIDAPIARKGRTGKMVVHPNGKASQTKFRVLEQYRSYALVEARLLTGRTHQIRVHFHTYDMPFVCDPLYGDPDGLYLSAFKKNYRGRETERPLIGRLSLHAHRLAFTHPKDGMHIEIKADLPKDFKAAIKQLRKWNAA